MDIKEKLTQQEKQMFENLRVETAVLEKLLHERRQLSGQVLKETLERLNHNPALFGLQFNFAEDKWDVILKPGALVLPGMQEIPGRIKGNLG